MKVYLPIFSSNVAGKTFSSTGQNPGVGGTQFNIVKLAFLLAQKFPDIEVILANHCDIRLNSNPINLKIELIPEINYLLNASQMRSQNDLIVMTAALLQLADPHLIRSIREKVIAWIHHPFFFNDQIRQMRLAAHVNVGSYQYFSNKIFFRSSWHIHNPFQITLSNFQKSFPAYDEPIRIVYLGALIPVKGFGHVARQWPALKAMLPNVELHVVGSSATYGKHPENDLIPCDRYFSEYIQKFIPENDITDGHVVFHGNLGEEKFEVMRSAHIALLNPTGASEAFPASPLECMGCGLPVITSNDYGMADSMRFFPELVLQHPEQIPSRVKWLLSDRYRYMELSERAIAIAKCFDSQTDVILMRWRQLFEAVLDTRTGREVPNRPPLIPVRGSTYKLWRRQLRALVGVAKRRVLSR